MHEPGLRFTGIFIPAEILEREDITLMEKFLFVLIDALKGYENKFYLASKLGTCEKQVEISIDRLKKLGLIETKAVRL